MALSAATRRLRRNIIFFNSGYNNELDGLPKLMMKMLTKNVDCEEALIQLRTRIPSELFVGMLRYHYDVSVAYADCRNAHMRELAK